jgi:hypothetical protein
MSELPTPPRRRWFQFSLGTMLILVTVCAVWLGVTANAVHKRREISGWLLEHGGWLEPDQNQTTISVGRRWMGDRAVGTVLLDMHERMPKGLTYEKIIEVFPESKVMLLSDHPGSNGWRPPNRAKEARDKAYAEKLHAKREVRKERMKGRQPPIENQ